MHGWSSEREHRRKQNVNGESDDSLFDGAEDQKKEDKVSTYEKKYDFEEKVWINFLLTDCFRTDYCTYILTPMNLSMLHFYSSS